jgi:hypothetical protein
MTTHKSIEEIGAKQYTSKIVHILAYQATITAQGENYTGEKDWALNKILKLMEDYARQQVQEAVEAKREYWIKVFDSAPVREKEHPHDIVAREFARIEVKRLTDLITSLQAEVEKLSTNQ